MSRELVCDKRESFQNWDELGNEIIENNPGTAVSAQVDGDRVCILFDK